MKAVIELQNKRPNLHCVFVGSDSVPYGNKRTDGRSWSDWAKQEFDFDLSRTHWLGIVQLDVYQRIPLGLTSIFILPFLLF